MDPLHQPSRNIVDATPLAPNVGGYTRTFPTVTGVPEERLVRQNRKTQPYQIDYRNLYRDPRAERNLVQVELPGNDRYVPPHVPEQGPIIEGHLQSVEVAMRQQRVIHRNDAPLHVQGQELINRQSATVLVQPKRIDPRVIK